MALKIKKGGKDEKADTKKVVSRVPKNADHMEIVLREGLVNYVVGTSLYTSDKIYRLPVAKAEELLAQQDEKHMPFFIPYVPKKKVAKVQRGAMDGARARDEGDQEQDQEGEEGAEGEEIDTGATRLVDSGGKPVGDKVAV